MSEEAESFRLSQNFPNPFNPSTKITIDILEDSYFELTVYDLVGKKVARLFKGQILKGKHDFEFDGSELPSGVYFYEAKTSASSEIRKMILSK
ncbi:MAG TPA: T9SS type A sorting domain-containing protein [Ignavibacteriales bacterium]|nr:T9SS type A sorting domain-containing protein [Ignavibacteriales bacterium]